MLGWSYLGNLAYSISQIKPGDLLRSHGLRFVTSSLEKKEHALKAEQENNPQKEKKTSQDGEGNETGRSNPINASSAYQIASSAAFYLHSQTKSMLHLKSTNSNPAQTFLEDETGDVDNMVSSMATTDSVTAVVAAEEEIKQAVADDLNSTSSSACEWFVCDDEKATRFFVIQESESLASWKANLLSSLFSLRGWMCWFTEVYMRLQKESTSRCCQKFRHTKSRGDCATLRFTGHSLGGSLALLINMMLLIRGVAPCSSLLPVITFGAPSIMCGGDHLLRNLGLSRDYFQSISMHRHIVTAQFQVFK